MFTHFYTYMGSFDFEGCSVEEYALDFHSGDTCFEVVFFVFEDGRLIFSSSDFPIVVDFLESR
ncbi:hypothetical protein [Microvirus mar25]|uniref:Uncharacterized protein n=1 Tax=Microvirus mar25 TaxID=2851158 RepID=A0A8F5MKK7_9VIRU|nr:hypothetical protein [Microvirus mar25]